MTEADLALLHKHRRDRESLAEGRAARDAAVLRLIAGGMAIRQVARESGLARSYILGLLADAPAPEATLD